MNIVKSYGFGVPTEGFQRSPETLNCFPLSNSWGSPEDPGTRASRGPVWFPIDRDASGPGTVTPFLFSPVCITLPGLCLDIMVPLLDHASEISAYERSNLCYLICLRHLIRPRVLANNFFASIF